MGEAYPKKSANPVNVTLLFTLVLGLITSTTDFSLGMVSKNFLILEKQKGAKVVKPSGKKQKEYHCDTIEEE